MLSQNALRPGREPCSRHARVTLFYTPFCWSFPTAGSACPPGPVMDKARGISRGPATKEAARTELRPARRARPLPSVEWYCAPGIVGGARAASPRALLWARTSSRKGAFRAAVLPRLHHELTTTQRMSQAPRLRLQPATRQTTLRALREFQPIAEEQTQTG